ncbi:hypothetical protein AB0N38_25795 [Micromonospora aurantiaca]|uniref:hypothetical protein n=1 Tax=Micromonospora aurantiaca (nom. illeg.) TaxID=47850 RepID=UPI0034243B09
MACSVVAGLAAGDGSTGTGWRWRSRSAGAHTRGYGPGAVTVLRLIRTGTPVAGGCRVRVRRAGLLRLGRRHAAARLSRRDPCLRGGGRPRGHHSRHRGQDRCRVHRFERARPPTSRRLGRHLGEVAGSSGA